MYKLTRIVMAFAPYGVFALIATTVAKYGLSVLAPFAKVILAVYLGCFLHALLVYSGLIMLVVKKSPLWYFSGVRESTLTAFVTRSSSATLPVTMRVAQENLGVSEGISSFVLPLGATINMDGTALYEAVAAIFIAQALGFDLSLTQNLIIAVTATLAAIGAAGIPEAGLVTMLIVLNAVNLPVEFIGLILPVDWLLDRFRTTVNVFGDAVGAAVVDRTM
jgi:Na+/H+-dicarboxylate symporter